MPTSDDPMLGRVLEGRYRVEEHIAEGGMATVYRGLDTRLDRPVAIKVMRSHLFHDESFRTRFVREARSAASLSHPAVVGVYDQGEDDGHMFLVMELVQGQTLRDLVAERGALPVGQAIEVVRRILQALGVAHRAGLIHRDVKPDNVLISDSGAIKVTDFGLARAVTSHTMTSSSGVLLGTVAYLSPEQVERGVADARSDVYAVGLLLVELLTGAKAFTGDTPIHVAYQHVHGGVPMPSSRNPGLSPLLDAYVAALTARDPDERPRDADAALTLLETLRRELTDDELGGGGGRAAVARSTPAASATQTSSAPIATNAPVAASPSTATEVIPTRAGGGGIESTTAYEPVSRELTVDPSAGPTAPAPSGAESAPRRRWVWLTLLLLVLAGAATAWYLLLGPGSMRVVPDVASLTPDAAASAVTRAELTPALESEFSETVAKDAIIRVAPGPGSEVRTDSTVTIVVSKGPERYAVPKVIGLPLSQVKDLLAESTLTSTETYEFSEKVAKDSVVSANPGSGEKVKRGARIALVVSKGPQPIAVKNFTGTSADAATAALTKAGLKVKDSEEFSESVPKGTVISQRPTSGELYKGDTVTLVVSKGPPLVVVPDVVGEQIQQARRTLEKAGFSVTVERVLGGFFNTVRSQSVAGGSSAPKGSTIVITVV